MKIIIAGLGKVGRALTRQLVSDGHDVVVIDRDPDLVEDIMNIYDVRGVAGNCGCYDVQNDAYESGTDLLIAATSSDEINILACLVAKKLGVLHTIARIRNPEYEDQLRMMRQELGLSMVINPEKAAAHDIARVLRFPSAIKREQFSKQRFELIEYRIGKDNPLDGLQLTELYRNMRVKVLICAIVRGEEVLIPSGNDILRQGDKIYVTAPARGLEQFFRRLGLFKAKASNIMIVGASRITYYLCRDLCDSQTKITIIDSDPARCRSMSESLPQALVIQGDATDSELLAEEGLADMDAFVALTGLDETNIILSMYASHMNSCRVVTKINRESFVSLVAANEMVDSIVSTRSVTIERILQYVRGMQNSNSRGSHVRALHRIAGGQVDALEFNVTREETGLVGIPLKDLSLKDNLLIAGIIRANGKSLIPSGSDVLSAGDDVIVVTTNTSLKDLSDILR